MEGPEDIWSCVCTPHVQEPTAAFSRELPGMGTDTLHLLTRKVLESCRRRVVGPHLILGNLEALLSELFRGFRTLH